MYFSLVKYFIFLNSVILINVLKFCLVLPQPKQKPLQPKYKSFFSILCEQHLEDFHLLIKPRYF